MVHISILEILLFSDVEYDSTISSSQEFSFFIQQFQGIPLTRIMRGSNDDSTICARHTYGKFCCRRGGKSDVYYIITYSHQRSANHILHHLARDTGITSYHYLIGTALTVTTDKHGISRGELHDIKGIQGIARRTTYCSTDTRNRFNKCHVFLVLYINLVSNLIVTGKHS